MNGIITPHQENREEVPEAQIAPALMENHIHIIYGLLRGHVVGSSYERNTELQDVRVGVPSVDAVCAEVAGDDVSGDDMCTICQDNLRACASDGKCIKRLHKCGHTYCSPCISMWLATSKKCPVCMTDVTEVNIRRDSF